MKDLSCVKLIESKNFYTSQRKGPVRRRPVRIKVVKGGIKVEEIYEPIVLEQNTKTRGYI